MDFSMKTYVPSAFIYTIKMYILYCVDRIDIDSVIGHNLTCKNIKIKILKYIIFYFYINIQQYINFTTYMYII